jgi:hypothetical protein
MVETTIKDFPKQAKMIVIDGSKYLLILQN